MAHYPIRAILIVVTLRSFVVYTMVLADDRSATAILKEIDANPVPTWNPRTADQSTIQKAIAKRRSVLPLRAKLIGDLFKADPSNPRLETLLPERWRTITRIGSDQGKSLTAEFDRVIAGRKNDKLKEEAVQLKAESAMRAANGDVAAAMKAIDEFIKHFPRGKGPSIEARLYELTDLLGGDVKVRKAVCERLIRDYPASNAARLAKGWLRRIDGVGKPFQLSFTDSISGSKISIDDFRGRVVVIDFWATWCGPCLREMPEIKKLYAEYKDRGVAFIGVSCDTPERGGVDRLKEYVESNKIPWPQYFDFDPSSRGPHVFTDSWGVDIIPSVFLVDQEGNLYSTYARGKLDKLIPELLSRHSRKAEPSGVR